MRHYLVEALIDRRQGQWLTEGPQKRQAVFMATSLKRARELAVMRWSKKLNRNESVVVMKVKAI